MFSIENITHSIDAWLNHALNPTMVVLVESLIVGISAITLFAVLGLVAGVVGIGFANLIARVLLGRMNATYHFHWSWNGLALLGTAALTVATGWLASHRILGQKPLEVLREE